MLNIALLIEQLLKTRCIIPGSLVRVVALINPCILLIRIIVRRILLQRKISSSTIVVIIIRVLDLVAESTQVSEHIHVRRLFHVIGEISSVGYVISY